MKKYKNKACSLLVQPINHNGFRDVVCSYTSKEIYTSHDPDYSVYAYTYKSADFYWNVRIYE